MPNKSIIKIPGLNKKSGCTYNAMASILDIINKDLKLEETVYHAHHVPYYDSQAIHLNALHSKKKTRIGIEVKEDTFTITNLPSSYDISRLIRKLNQQQ